MSRAVPNITWEHIHISFLTGWSAVQLTFRRHEAVEVQSIASHPSLFLIEALRMRNATVRLSKLLKIHKGGDVVKVSWNRQNEGHLQAHWSHTE